MKTIATIEGERIYERADDTVTWTAKMAIDVDGKGPKYHDPDAQNDTTLHYKGEPLNADEDRYIVVPPIIPQSVEGVVLGCQGMVVNLRTGAMTDCVVGDIGPHKKLGEASRAVALALGINGSPTTGGVDEHIVLYTIKPGLPAVVEGKHYELQPYED